MTHLMHRTHVFNKMHASFAMKTRVRRGIIGAGNARLAHTVVLIRHGESLWNLEKRFTGWCDVPLTPMGEGDAKDAGLLLGERKIKFDVAFTSTLERAWRTCSIIASASGQSDLEIVRSWRLNERHYGALQGHSKNSPRLIEQFGEEKLIEWRRSYHTAPPSLYDQDFLTLMGADSLNVSTSLMNPKYINKSDFCEAREKLLTKLNMPSFRSTFMEPNTARMSDQIFPATESLKECQDRAFGYWKDVIGPRVKAGQKVLIVAHANTIRALVKELDNIDDDMIAHLKIPNGVPLVYTLDDNLQPIIDLTDDIGFQANYLVSARNHARTMSYERCVKKKLRSLFEYLDTDHDGRITQTCLLRGLSRLQSYASGQSYMIYDGDNGMGHRSLEDQYEKKLFADVCEYEIEELIRCVPAADEYGGITLKALLDAEETILPKLSKLRLLQ